MKRICGSGDDHIPYHDPTARDLELAFLAHFKPDIYVKLGDWLDFWQVSDFDRDPAQRDQLEDNIQQARAHRATLDYMLGPSCRKVMLGGNHEDRLRRAIWRNAPYLAWNKANDIPALLELDTNGWEYIPYHDPNSTCGAPGCDIGGVLWMHGRFASQISAASAKKHFERYHVSGVCGHTHRQGEFRFTAYGGDFKWIEAGCLCTLNPTWTDRPNWQQGIVAGYLWDDDNSNPAPRFDLRTVPITHHKLAWEGRIFKA